MYEFGDVVVDPRAREVRRGEATVHLEPQAFDLLVHLIEHRDEVVPKQRLLDAVWCHGFVTESALTTRIKEVRRALGDDGGAQHTIRTVRGRGYRFVAPVTEVHLTQVQLTEVQGRQPAGTPTRALVGRDEDLAAVLRLLEREAVVTVVGPGGVGKSALAQAALARLAPAAYLVELAPLTGGDAVLPTLARALDAAYDGQHREDLVTGLARRDAVLVLDNCEHVVDSVAVVVDGLLSTPGRRLRILATSQVRLGVSAEHLHALGPLETLDAVALFVERVAAVRPSGVDAHLDAAGRERLARLVEHLDRLPLTIEMAAGRLASMTLDDLETAVRDAGLLTRMSHRTPTVRHRTLAALVEWSVDLLPERQRDAFARMSVFAGAVRAADAAAVLGAGAAVDLAELAERSLLVADLGGTTARYRMLETVRVAAAERLEQAGDRPESQRRHARWVAEVVEGTDRALRGPDEAAGRRRLKEVTDELRAGHRWAREHDPGLAERMCTALHTAAYNRVWAEPAAWAADLIERHGPTPGAVLLVAGAAANAGDLDRAESLAEAVLQTLAADGSEDFAAMALDILSDASLYRGSLEQADARAIELAGLGERLGEPHWMALAAVNRSLARTFAGDAAAGLAVLEDADRVALSTSARAWLCYAGGEAHAGMGSTDEATAAFTRAIDLGEEAGNAFVTSVSHSALAAMLGRAGSRAEACAAYAAGLTSALRHGNLVHAMTMVRNLAALLESEGDSRAAAELTEQLALDPDAAVRRAIDVVGTRSGG